mgnify:CR=1 FL=1|tara:strand:- start:2068 stop:2667 length:600 start_codon:yes stop_codon:yes gene_type:complete
MDIYSKYEKQINETYRGGLRAWFGKGPVGSATGGGWDRYDSTGKKAGKCGDAKTGSSYSACLGKKYASRLRAKGGKKAIANWVKRKKSAQRSAGRGEKGSGGKGKAPVRVSYTKESLSEIFTIQHTQSLKQDLVNFLKSEFQKGNIQPIHSGPSTSDFNPSDWLEPMADDLVNKLVQYFQVVRGQTEKDMYSPVPIQQD